MKQLLYIGEFDFFKQENASTYRIKTMCKAIECEGKFETKIIGYHKAKSIFKRIVGYIFRGFYFARKIKKENPDMVVYYGGSTRIVLSCLFLCRCKNIKFYADVVEWYDYNSLPAIVAFDHRLAMNYFLQKINGIIAISSFLEQHFKKKNPKVLLVPVLWDFVNEKADNNEQNMDTNTINLVIASELNKNYPLQEIINSINGYTFHIVGYTWEELIKMYSIPDEMKIKCYGKVSQPEARKIIGRCDFTIFIRNYNRTAMAGFPSKFVESLSLGTPVIANITTDMGKYLIEGFNGYVLTDITQSVISEKLRIIRGNFNREQHSQMREDAQNSARNNFDYRLYAKQLGEFLER